MVGAEFATQEMAAILLEVPELLLYLSDTFPITNIMINPLDCIIITTTEMFASGTASSAKCTKIRNNAQLSPSAWSLWRNTSL